MDTIDGLFQPFDPYVKQQLELRKKILSTPKIRLNESTPTSEEETLDIDTIPDGDEEAHQLDTITITGRSTTNFTQEQFFALTTEKQSVIRMCSGVNVKESFKEKLEPGEEYLTNGNGVGLARQYILEGGTKFFNNNGEYNGVREGFTTGNDNDDVSRGFSYGDKNIRANPSKLDDGTPDYGIVPMPGITNAEIRTKSPNGSLREAKVNFSCHNRRQLELLEMLYMRPGYPILLEWGWSPYLSSDTDAGAEYGKVESLDMSSTVDEFLSPSPSLDMDGLNQLIKQKKIEASGNYDGFIGFCKNFTFKAREDGGYECTTEIIAHGEILESLKSTKILTDSREYSMNQPTKRIKLSIDTEQYYLPVPSGLESEFSPLEMKDNIVITSGSSYRASIHTEVDDSFLFYLKSIKANLDKAGDAAFLRYHNNEDMETQPVSNTLSSGTVKNSESAGYNSPDSFWKNGSYQAGYKYQMEDGTKHLLHELNRVGDHYIQGFEILQRLYTSITKALTNEIKDDIVEPTLNDPNAIYRESEPGILETDDLGNDIYNPTKEDTTADFEYHPIDQNTGASNVTSTGQIHQNWTNYEGQGIRSMLGGSIVRQITKQNIDTGDNRIKPSEGEAWHGVSKSWKQNYVDRGYRKNVFVRWDFLCQIMNHLSIEQYAPGKPLVEWTYANRNVPLVNLDNEQKEEGIGGYYIPYAPPKIDTLDPSWNSEKYTSNQFHPILGQSFNHKVCLLPHQPIFNNLFQGFSKYDPFAFEAHPKRTDGTLGPAEYITDPNHKQAKIAIAAGGLNTEEGRNLLNTYSLIGIKKTQDNNLKERVNVTYDSLSSFTNISMERNSIGAIYFNLDHLINTYVEMSQEVLEEENLTGQKSTTVRLKESFTLMDYITKIWNNVNESCAGQYNFQISTEHERPNRVRIIDRTVSGKSPNNIYKFDPQGLNSITRDFYYDSKIDSDMASMISIAAQAPNEINSLQSLSFRAFHKNIFNRFTDPSKINQKNEDRKNRSLKLRMQKDVNQYAQTLDSLDFYLEKLNNGNYELEFKSDSEDEEPTERLIGHQTAIRYAKQLSELKSGILMRIPLKDKEGNWNDGPTYENTGEGGEKTITRGTENREFAGTAKDDKIHERNAIIPLSFNIKMDGISGIIPLQLFKVNKEKLPIGYQDDRISFIIHSENHKITAGQDWTVELGGQLVFTGGKDDELAGDALAQNPPLPLYDESISLFVPSPNNNMDEIDELNQGFLVSQGDVFNSGWINPIEYIPIHSSAWGEERGSGTNQKRHTGADYKGTKSVLVDGFQQRDKLRSPMDGKVRLVQLHKTQNSGNKNCGNELIIDHYLDGQRDANGYLLNKEFSGISSKFCHMLYREDSNFKSTIYVQPAQEVVRGQHVGYMGGKKNDIGRGNTTGIHLHFEVRQTLAFDKNYYVLGRTEGYMDKSPRQPDWWNVFANGNVFRDTTTEDPANYLTNEAQGEEFTKPWYTTQLDFNRNLQWTQDAAGNKIPNTSTGVCPPFEKFKNSNGIMVPGIEADSTNQQWQKCQTRYLGDNNYPLIQKEDTSGNIYFENYNPLTDLNEIT